MSSSIGGRGLPYSNSCVTQLPSLAQAYRERRNVKNGSKSIWPETQPTINKMPTHHRRRKGGPATFLATFSDIRDVVAWIPCPTWS